MVFSFSGPGFLIPVYPLFSCQAHLVIAGIKEMNKKVKKATTVPKYFFDNDY